MDSLGEPEPSAFGNDHFHNGAQNRIWQGR